MPASALADDAEDEDAWAAAFPDTPASPGGVAPKGAAEAPEEVEARLTAEAYDALLAGGMGELLLDDELTSLDNEIEKCGQNAAERIILVYEGKHRGEV